MARAVRRTELNECRQCATFCDRVIRPATCVAAACPALYQYDDPLTGKPFPYSADGTTAKLTAGPPPGTPPRAGNSWTYEIVFVK